MPAAYLLVNTDLGVEQQVMGELGRMRGVKESHFVYGVYDIIVEIEADGIDEVKDTVRAVRGLRSVRSTLTMMVVE